MKFKDTFLFGIIPSIKNLNLVSFVKESIKYIKKNDIGVLIAGYWIFFISSSYKTTKIRCHFGDWKFAASVIAKKLSKQEIKIDLIIHAHSLYTKIAHKYLRENITYANTITTISLKNKEILCKQFGLIT